MMGKSLFFSNGAQPTLQEVLDTRENRALFQAELCRRYPQHVLIALKCNIPGPIKNNEAIQQLFEIGIQELQQQVQERGWPCTFEKTMSLPTGPEYFVMVDAPPLTIKKMTIAIETASAIGRLWDMDVLYFKGTGIHTINRGEAGLEPRSCFICSKSAKECGRNRTHTIEEMLTKIEELMIKDGRVSQS